MKKKILRVRVQYEADECTVCSTGSILFRKLGHCTNLQNSINMVLKKYFLGSILYEIEINQVD